MGFANSVIGGAAALIRAAIKSPNYVAGSAGWQISKSGSAEFNNVVIRGTVTGNFYVLNSSGLFIYSGSPAVGNLIYSDASAAGNDQAWTSAPGNSYVQGAAVYTTIGGQKFILTMGTVPNSSPSEAGFYLQTGVNPAFQPPSVSSTTVGSAGTAFVMGSGGSLVGSTQSFVQLKDSTLSSVTNGTIQLGGGQVLFGQTAVALWDDTAQQLGLPKAGGPFIPGEGFHSISLATGLAGRFACKLLPWNMVLIVLQNVACTSVSTSYTLGTLPTADYYPANTQHLAVANTGAINSRLFIPTSGALQLIAASSPTGTTFGLSDTYPNN